MATSLDVIKLNDMSPYLIPADDIGRHFPELGYFEASTVPDIVYKGLAVDLNPDNPLAAFRAVNTGRVRYAPDLTLKTIECKYLDASWTLDRAIATGDPRNQAFAIQAYSHLKAAFRALGNQIWQGTGFNASGFPGFPQLITTKTPKIAIGTASTAAGDINYTHTIWAVKSSLDTCQLAWGKNGVINEGPIKEGTLPGSPAGTTYEGYSQAIESWAGLQVLSSYSFGKATVVSTEADGDGLITDDLLYDLIAEFPSGYEPTAFFMNRKTLSALRKSRTATNPTGAPAPMPSELDGIKIYVTESIPVASAAV